MKVQSTRLLSEARVLRVERNQLAPIYIYPANGYNGDAVHNFMVRVFIYAHITLSCSFESDVAAHSPSPKKRVEVEGSVVGLISPDLSRSMGLFQLTTKNLRVVISTTTTRDTCSI